MNPIEITLNRPGDNKTHSRADIRCKWTPLFLQGEHFITTIFWIPDGSPLQVRLREQKKSTWLNKTQNTTSLVEKTLRPNSCLKSKIIHKNIAGSPHLFIRQITTHCIWPDLVKVSI